MTGAAAAVIEAQAAVAKTATYVVQARHAQVFGGGGDDWMEAHPDGEFWRDVATVTVPSGSKRKRIIREAQMQGLELPATVRILDAVAAAEIAVSLGEAERPLVIG